MPGRPASLSPLEPPSRIPSTFPALALTLLALAMLGIAGAHPNGVMPSARSAGVQLRSQVPLWAAGHALYGADKASTRITVPYFDKALPGFATRIHVMNVGDSNANVTITLVDGSTGDEITGCGAQCTATVVRKNTHTFDLAEIPVVPNVSTGWAIVTGDQDLLVVVSSRALEIDGTDMASYLTTGPDHGLAQVHAPLTLKQDVAGTNRDEAFSTYFIANPAFTGSRSAQTTLRPHMGGPSVDLDAVTIDPLSVAALNLWLDASVPDGAYAGQVDVIDGGVTVVGTRWNPHDSRSWSKLSAEPHPEPLLPLVFKRRDGRCSIMSVHNPSQANSVSINAHLERPAPLPTLSPPVTTTRTIPAGQTTRIDLCDDADLAALPDDFAGSLTIDADSIAVVAHALADVAGQPALADYEHVSHETAADALYAPVVHVDYPAWPANPDAPHLDTTIAVMNPESSDADVTVHYYGNSGPCAGQIFTHGPRTVPAGRSLHFEAGPGGGSGLPSGCQAAAVIQSTGARVVAIALDEAYDAGSSTPTATNTPPTPSPSPSATHTPTPGCVQPPTDMVAWWSFDEASGVTAADRAANSLDGLLSGTPVWGPSTGKVRGALRFDGNTTYVEVPDHPALDFGVAGPGAGDGDFSMDAWIRIPATAATSGVRTLLDKRASSGGRNGYHIYLFNRQLSLQLADTTFSPYNSNYALPNDDQWHHVAVTVDRDVADGIRFYLDGAEVGTRGDPTQRPGSLSNDVPLRIGSISGTPSSFFDGWLDEYELFDRALAAGEVAALYAADARGKCTPTPIASITPTYTPTRTSSPSITPSVTSSTPSPSPTRSTPTRRASDTPSPTFGTPSPSPTYTPTPTPGCVAPPTDMVAWWSLDEAGGTTVADRSPFGHTGTVSDAGGWGPSSGKVRGALRLDGGGRFVQVPSSQALNFGTMSMGSPAGDLSLDAWVRLPADAQWSDVRSIVDKRDSAGTRGYHLYLWNRQLSLQLADTDFSPYNSTVLVPLDDAWHHIAVTVDRDAVDGIRFYLDGTEVGTRGDPTLRPGSLSSANALRLGRLSFNNTFRFDGWLDEVEIFRRALSPSEVSALYAADSLGKCTPTPDTSITPTPTPTRTHTPSITPTATGGTPRLITPSPSPSLTLTPSPTPTSRCVEPPADMVAWWTFDENGGAVAKDLLAAKNHGQRLGGAAWLAPTQGHVRGAMRFNGSTSRVSVPDHPALDFGAMVMGTPRGDFSIDAWIRIGPDNDTWGARTIVEKSSGFQAGYDFYLVSTELGLQITDVSSVPGSLYWNSGAKVPQDNRWHHVAVTIDRDENDGVRFFLDGTEVGNRADPTIRPDSLDNPYDLTIGNRTAGNYQQFDGDIDEVEIFARALHADEIAALHAASTSGKCRPPRPPCPVEDVFGADPTRSSANRRSAEHPTPAAGPATRLGRLLSRLAGGLRLTSLAQTFHEVDVLRRVRDEVLAPNEGGLEIVRRYDRHSDELRSLLRADTALADDARALVVELVPFVEPLLDPEATGPAPTLTRAQVDAMDGLLARLRAGAGPQLAIEITTWRARIAGWEGKTSAEIWDTLRAGGSTILLPYARR